MPKAARKPLPGETGSIADRLIEAAEELIGHHGLDGTSLRQIAAAAAAANNYAVQYHFRDMDGLIAAILTRRIPGVEADQAEKLEALTGQGRQSEGRALIEILLKPLLEPLNAKGERAYARFIAALLNSAEGTQHCTALFALTPSTAQLLSLLHRAHPALSFPMLRERLRLVTILVCTSVFNRSSGIEATDDMLIESALDMATAALAA